MKTHDALGRRNRYVRVPTRASTDTPLSPNAGDLLMMEAIHHHGPLSSRYLPTFRAQKYGSHQNAVRRLNTLSNEINTVDEGAYLFRPAQQKRTEYAHSKHLVYDLTPDGVACLQRLGLWSDSNPQNRNPWTHTFMTAAITASIELECIRAGHKFIHGSFILDRASGILRQNVPFILDGKTYKKDLIPDALFAIEYSDGTYRSFIVEADRGTEPVKMQTASRKSFERNLRQYQSFVGDRLYKEPYGLSSKLIVLNAFTRKHRMKSCMEIAEKVCKTNSYMCFMAFDHFGDVFAPPPILSEVREKGWQRVGHPDMLILDSKRQ